MLFRSVAGMERLGEVTATGETAIAKPSLKRIAVRMQGEEILEIVVGEQEIRDTSGFAFVLGGTTLVVAMVEIEIRPDFDGGFFTTSTSRAKSSF